MGEMIDLYRGNANTWECDENGHLNVQFYTNKVNQGFAVLAERIGLGVDVLDGMGARLSIEDQHMRYLRELHPGAGVYGRGGVLEAGRQHLRIYIELVNGFTDEVSATFNFNAACRSLKSGDALDLPKGVEAAADKVLVDLPKHGAPRSFDLATPSIVTEKAPTLADTEDMGLIEIMRGAVGPHECDVHGFLENERYIGRISDGIVNMARRFRIRDSLNERSRGKLGGAVLEYWLHFHEPLRVGDLIVVRSGLKAVHEKSNQFVHWMFNAKTGRLVSSSEAVAVTLDLEARKIVPLPDERRVHMEGLVVPDLRA